MGKIIQNKAKADDVSCLVDVLFTLLLLLNWPSVNNTTGSLSTSNQHAVTHSVSASVTLEYISFLQQRLGWWWQYIRTLPLTPSQPCLLHVTLRKVNTSHKINSHPPADSQPILQIQALFEGIPQFPEFFKSIQQHRGFVYYFLNNAQSLIQFSSMRFLYYHLIKTKR